MQRRLIAPLALSLAGALALAASAQGEKPTLTLTATTTRTSIPGLANIELPKGVELPPEARALLGGAGQRSLLVRLARPGAPPANPSAELDIPGGLKLGPTLVLDVPRPAGGGKGEDVPTLPQGFEKFEIRQYWGCSAAVRPGQPRVLRGGGLPVGQIPRGPVPGTRGGAGAEGVSAHWPNGRQKTPPIAAEAALPGKYQLRTNLTPNLGFEVPSGVTFLPPVELTATSDLAKPVKLSWKPVAGALGYIAIATGSNGKNTMIMWSSAETGDAAAAFGSSGDPRDLVQKGILMKPDRVECTIPAGIFAGCQGVSVMFRAIGPSFEQAGSTPAVKVETESMATLVLGIGGDEPDEDE